MSEYETTFPVLTQFDQAELDALKRFIAEERPDLGQGQAVRVLAREAMIGMGLLDPRERK